MLIAWSNIINIINIHQHSSINLNRYHLMYEFHMNPRNRLTLSDSACWASGSLQGVGVPVPWLLQALQRAVPLEGHDYTTPVRTFADSFQQCAHGIAWDRMGLRASKHNFRFTLKEPIYPNRYSPTIRILWYSCIISESWLCKWIEELVGFSWLRGLIPSP